LSFAIGVLAEWKELRHFNLITRGGQREIHIQSMHGVETLAATFPKSALSPSFLDTIEEEDIKIKTKEIYIEETYKIHFPNHKVVSFKFDPEDRKLKIKSLAPVPRNPSVAHLMYERPVTLTTSGTPYFNHENWYLGLRTDSEDLADLASMTELGTVYFRVIPSVKLVVSQNIDIGEFSQVSFLMENEERVVTIGIDLTGVKVQQNGLAVTQVNTYCVSIMAVDATDASMAELASYTKVDDHRYFVPEFFNALISLVSFLSGIAAGGLYVSSGIKGSKDDDAVTLVFLVSMLSVFTFLQTVKGVVNTLAGRTPSRSTRQGSLNPFQVSKKSKKSKKYMQ